LGTVSVLAEATKKNIAGARRYFPEGNASDFEVSGRVWTDKATGQAYVIAHGQPLASNEPRKCADVFVVNDDRLVLLLRAERYDVPEQSVEVGNVGGRTATVHDPVASDEPVVY